VKEHLARFADEATGMALYKGLTRQLIADKRTEDAKACCQAALRQLGDQQQAAPFHRILREFAKEEQAQRNRNASLARIKTKLGGHDDGYFVLFVHRPVVTVGSPVDYVVCEGLSKAVAYIGTINRGLVWEQVGWFPRTTQGKKKAHALCNRLIEENTYSTYSVR
jgi:hypothetical protein